MLSRTIVVARLAMLISIVLLTGCLGGGSQIGSQFEISGTVQGVDGTGIGNIDVTASGGQSVTTRTSDDGTFVLSGLTGTVRVEASSDAYVLSPAYVAGVSGQQDLTFLALANNAFGDPVPFTDQEPIAFGDAVILDPGEATIPPGATVTVEAVENPANTGGLNVIGPALSITLAGADTLDQPITLSFRGELEGSAANYGLFVYNEAEGSWTYVPVVYEAGWFSAEVQHLSVWLLATAEQVQPVTADPDSGPVEPGIKVTLTSETAGAHIYYTLDGTAPSRTSPLFDPEHPIKITDDVEIHAFAVKGNWIDSDTASFAYSLLTPVSITGLPDNLTLTTLESVQLTYTLEPAAANVTFASSDEAVATVSSGGLVAGKTAGQTTITVTATKDGYLPAKETLKVTVTEPPAISLTDLQEELALSVGDSSQLTYSVDPADATVTFASDNAAIAAVSSEGLVTGNAVGETTVTVTAVKDGYLPAAETVQVTVTTVPAISLAGVPEELALSVGETAELSYTVDPTDATVTFASDNPAIAAVSSEGLITALAAGETTLTVSAAKDGFLPAAETVQITVTEPTTISLTGLPEELAMSVADTLQLTFVVNPADATVTFVSADPSIAAVNDEGLITAQAPGMTNITVTAVRDGFVDAETVVEVTVEAVNEEFAGGTGSPEDPFQIATIEHLDNVRNHLRANFVLVNDIVFTTDSTDGQTSASSQSLTGWEPIGTNTVSGAFGGYFDGNHFSIVNLYVDKEGSNFVGLFAFMLNAEIRNLSLQNAYVRGRDQVGVLAGSNNGSDVDNVSISGTVIGRDNVGGLVGVLRNATASNSSVTATVTARNAVGGLTGDLFGGSTIENSTVDVVVSGQNRVGGLAGQMTSSGVVKATSAYGTVSGIDDVGGMVGIIEVNDQVAVTADSYAQVDVEGERRVGGLVGELKRGTLADVSAHGTVRGTGNTEGVGGLVGRVGNINLVEVGHIKHSYATGDVFGSARVGGLVGTLQRGTIADSYSSSDLAASEGSTFFSAFGGLVGRAENAAESITNSYATGNISVNGSNLGGFAGILGNVTVTDSYAGGDVLSESGTQVGGFAGSSSALLSNVYALGSVSGNQQIGGLVGSNSDSGTVEDSYAEGSVDGVFGFSLGGLVGSNRGAIRRSIAYGDVQGGPVTPGALTQSIGGLAGRNEGSIEDSQAAGRVGGDQDRIGGLVGYNRGSISRSWATGAVVGTNGTESATKIGGLVGHSDPGGVIENSYASGSVTGSGYEQVGGLVGFNQGEITNSYAIAVTIGKDKVGGLVGENAGTINRSYYNQEIAVTNGHGTARTTAQMTFPFAENTYVDWDFDEVWLASELENDGYPWLR